MSDLLDFYKQMSATTSLFEEYTSIAKDKAGCMFHILNTNYRAILTPVSKLKSNYGYGGFAKGFEVLEAVEGTPREQWSSKNNAGQEIEKQHTVHMRNAVLFQFREDNAFHKTHRGEVFKKMLLDSDLGDDEKRLLCYTLILSGHFLETSNYLFTRTRAILEMLNSQGISAETVLDSIVEIVKGSVEGKKEDLFAYNYVYYDSFFSEKAEFLKVFAVATPKELSEFKAYIINSVSALKNSYSSTKHNILSKKYVNGGVYTGATLIENAWLLYVSYKLQQIKLFSFDSFVDELISAYSELFPINESAVRKFIYDPNQNRSVFQIIFNELYGIAPDLSAVANAMTLEEIEEVGIIDPTDIYGFERREILTTALKKLARLLASHRCECETAEDCRYFTSKETGENYLEIHHFIPREFSNDYDYSIEVLSNYIPLCPNCHRKIHHATDGERKHLIRILFEKRKELLAKEKLIINLNELFDYYKIDKQ